MVAKVRVKKGHTIISCNCKAPKGGLKPWMLFAAIAAAGTTTYVVTSLINKHFFGGTALAEKSDVQRRQATREVESGWAEGF